MTNNDRQPLLSFSHVIFHFTLQSVPQMLHDALAVHPRRQPDPPRSQPDHFHSSTTMATAAWQPPGIPHDAPDDVADHEDALKRSPDACREGDDDEECVVVGLDEESADTDHPTADVGLGSTNDSPALLSLPQEAQQWVRCGLPYKSFTKVQLRCAAPLLTSDHNVVVAAPTGSGKTVLFEFAMVRLFRHRFLQSRSQGGQGDGGGATSGKAIYVSPTKALAAEKYHSWRRMWSHRYGLKVVLETGDTAAATLTSVDAASVSTETYFASRQAADADIVVTTPERWDSLTRRWKEGAARAFMDSVRLIMLDEAHSVGEPRGAALEALVSRMKSVSASALRQTDGSDASGGIRFVAVSATMPNIGDFGEWLGAPAHAVFAFTEAERPVPLSVHVVSYPRAGRNPFQFDRFLTFKLPSIVRHYADGKPTLIFCVSRRETSASAAHIAADMGDDVVASLPPSARHQLLTTSGMLLDAKLRECVKRGVGFHHAAMHPKDRQTVEELFLTHALRVVCSTTTLAVGVNLPARLVIVKGTWNAGGGGCAGLAVAGRQLSTSDIAQMTGRAGRPGLDVVGVAVVLTSDDCRAPYDAMRSGAEVVTPVESHLHRHMAEHVNAEVALRTLRTPEMAVGWLRTTFLWVRLKKNPSYYSPTATSPRTSAEADGDCNDTDTDRPPPPPPLLSALWPDSISADRNAEQLIVGILARLLREGCIKIPALPSSTSTSTSSSSVCLLEPTKLGKLVARYYLAIGTLARFNQEVPWPKGAAVDHAPPSVRLRQHRRMAQTRGNGAVAPEVVPLFQPEAPTTIAQLRLLADAMISAPLRSTTDAEALNADDGGDAGTRPFSVRQCLCLVSQAEEFTSDCRLRLGDKRHLHAINRAVRFPLTAGNGKGTHEHFFRGTDVREPWHKVFLLAQGGFLRSHGPAALDGDLGSSVDAEGGGTVLTEPSSSSGTLDDARATHVSCALTALADPSLRNDSFRLWSSLPRVAKGLVEYMIAAEHYTGIVAAWRTLRCVEQRLWWDAPRLTRQLSGVGEAVSRLLERGGVSTLRDVIMAAPRRLEAMCNRQAPFGTDLKAKCAHCPMPSVVIAPLSSAPPHGARQSGQAAADRLDFELRLSVAMPAREDDASHVPGEQIIPRADSSSGERTMAAAFVTVAVGVGAATLLLLRRCRLSPRDAMCQITFRFSVARRELGQVTAATPVAMLQAVALVEACIGLDATCEYDVPLPSAAPAKPLAAFSRIKELGVRPRGADKRVRSTTTAGAAAHPKHEERAVEEEVPTGSRRAEEPHELTAPLPADTHPPPPEGGRDISGCATPVTPAAAAFTAAVVFPAPSVAMPLAPIDTASSEPLVRPPTPLDTVSRRAAIATGTQLPSRHQALQILAVPRRPVDSGERMEMAPNGCSGEEGPPLSPPAGVESPHHRAFTRRPAAFIVPPHDVPPLALRQCCWSSTIGPLPAAAYRPFFPEPPVAPASLCWAPLPSRPIPTSIPPTSIPPTSIGRSQRRHDYWMQSAQRHIAGGDAEVWCRRPAAPDAGVSCGPESVLSLNGSDGAPLDFGIQPSFASWPTYRTPVPFQPNGEEEGASWPSLYAPPPLPAEQWSMEPSDGCLDGWSAPAPTQPLSNPREREPYHGLVRQLPIPHDEYAPPCSHGHFSPISSPYFTSSPRCVPTSRPLAAIPPPFASLYPLSTPSPRDRLPPLAERGGYADPFPSARHECTVASSGPLGFMAHTVGDHALLRPAPQAQSTAPRKRLRGAVEPSSFRPPFA